MRVAVYRFPCEMLRALPLGPDQQAPESVVPACSLSQGFCHAVNAPCDKVWDCRGTFVCETELPSRGLRRHLRSMRGGKRR